MKQSIDANGEIPVAGEKRSGEKRQARTGTHTGDLNQSSSKRNGAAGITCGGLIVRRPLRKFRPVVFERAKRTEKRESVRGEKNEETFDVVARNEMGALVAQSSAELFGGKSAENAAGDEQTRTKQSRHGEKRSFALDDEERRRFSRNARFVARAPAEPIVLQGDEESMSASRDGDGPSRSAKQPQDGADCSDTFGSGGGLEPEITGNAEAQDEESGERTGKHAQGQQKTGGGAGRFRFRETDSGF